MQRHITYQCVLKATLKPVCSVVSERFFVFTQLFCKKSFFGHFAKHAFGGLVVLSRSKQKRMALPKTFASDPCGQKEGLMSDKRFVLANSLAEWTRIDLLMLPPKSPKWKPKQTNLLENCCFFLSHFKKTFSLLPQSFPVDFSISFGASSQMSPVSDCFQVFAMLCFAWARVYPSKLLLIAEFWVPHQPLQGIWMWHLGCSYGNKGWH